MSVLTGYVKNLRVQDWLKAFVFVHTYAWASLEKNVNKPLSTIPYTLIFLGWWVVLHLALFQETAMLDQQIGRNVDTRALQEKNVRIKVAALMTKHQTHTGALNKAFKTFKF